MNKDRAVFRLYTGLGRALGALPEPVALWAAARVGDAMFVMRHQHREMIRRLGQGREIGIAGPAPDFAAAGSPRAPSPCQENRQP